MKKKYLEDLGEGQKQKKRDADKQDERKKLRGRTHPNSCRS